jgi:hypothetical protein
MQDIINQDRMFFYKTTSNSASTVSEAVEGFVRAPNTRSAIERIIRNNPHPGGLYSASVHATTPEQTLLGRWLSPTAVAIEEAGRKGHHNVSTRGRRVYIDGELLILRTEPKIEILRE